MMSLVRRKQDSILIIHRGQPGRVLFLKGLHEAFLASMVSFIDWA